MDRKRLGWALAALGAVLVVLSALADQIGLGGDDGFGWKQATGVIVGAAGVLVGLWYARRGGEGSAPAEL